MSVQSEKLKLIEWLVGLKDIGTLEKLSKVRKDSIEASYEASLKPMTQDELSNRAKESNKNIEEGKVYNIETILDPK